MENIIPNSSVDCYSLHQEMINHSLQGEILNVKIENDKLKNENDELKAQLERAKVYLKATSDLLQKQNENLIFLKQQYSMTKRIVMDIV